MDRRDMMRSFLLGAFSFAALCAQTSEDAAADAADQLRHVGYFAFGGVGDAGTTSSGEKALRVVMAQPAQRSLSLLKNIYERANNPAAECYALAGIHKLNSLDFQQLYKSLALSNKPVTTMRGCIMGKESLGSIVTAIASGFYDQQI